MILVRMSFKERYHWVKIVHSRSFSDPYFPAFGLNTGRYSVSLRIQSECGKIRTRKTPNTDTFDALALDYDNLTFCAGCLSLNPKQLCGAVGVYNAH